MKIEKRPYKLINHIQNYEWGTRGREAFIPKLLGFEGEEIPYAELWIGGHPKLSSELLINGEKHTLKDVVEKYPNEILGEFVVDKFGKNIPFLLKVLSANQALSIQTHPNKSEAIELHKNDSRNYPDDNHKPEIAIALDSLTALVGFRPLDDIENNLSEYVQLSKFIGYEIVSNFLQNKTKNGLKIIFSKLLNNSTNREEVVETIEYLINEFHHKTQLSEDESLFLSLHKQYGVDIGLLLLFFLNVVNLKSGEAIFTPSGIPHAYLKGNIVECMANSDNVVRAGLTTKFKDIAQLTNMLTYEFGYPELVGNMINKNLYKYNIPVEEFNIENVTLNNESIEFDTDGRIEILLIIEGEAICNNLPITKGESLLLPAILNSYTVISKSKTTYFRVVVPK